MSQKWTLTGHGYMVRNVKGAVVYQHREVVEKVLGRKLRGSECIHHIDGDRTNNKNSNLVVCPDSAYHNLLHKREEALDACGHPDWLKCCYCHKHSPPEEIRVYKRSPPRHGGCNKKYFKEWYAKKAKELDERDLV